uniref:Glycosyltransferase family 92 protein n=1 Tax=Meloidogyne floridensis TaxID=298350 RepID=A0A915NVJ8_9BILA
MMHTVESPTETLLYYDKNLLTNKFFNSSATYRVDSSVFMPYDALTKITPTTPKEYIWNQNEVILETGPRLNLRYTCGFSVQILTHEMQS